MSVCLPLCLQTPARPSEVEEPNLADRYILASPEGSCLCQNGVINYISMSWNNLLIKCFIFNFMAVTVHLIYIDTILIIHA